jgi:hypothetical protein
MTPIPSWAAALRSSGSGGICAHDGVNRTLIAVFQHHPWAILISSPSRTTPARGDTRNAFINLFKENPMTESIAGVVIPDSRMARAATELVRDTETDLLYHHSRRVFLFGALAGQRQALDFDAELLYIGAMFHDMGLLAPHSSPNLRFEVDGANAARDFLRSYGVGEGEVEQVWDAIALHTTPGIPEHKKPVVALLTAGVEMDVLGIGYAHFSDEQRQRVVAVHPRGEGFKEGIIDAFANGTAHKPETTFGNVKADVLALKKPGFRRTNFCGLILNSAWNDACACGSTAPHKH